jgi:hypothetical protein
MRCFDSVTDQGRRFFDGEKRPISQVHRRGSGFDLNEENVFAVDQDFAAFVDAVELYQGHSFLHVGGARTLIKPIPIPRPLLGERAHSGVLGGAPVSNPA